MKNHDRVNKKCNHNYSLERIVELTEKVSDGSFFGSMKVKNGDASVYFCKKCLHRAALIIPYQYPKDSFGEMGQSNSKEYFADRLGLSIEDVSFASG